MNRADLLNAMNLYHRYSLMPYELLFYCALILNISYSIFYPVYSALHDNFSHIIILFTILIFLSIQRWKYNGIQVVKVVMFILLCLITILVNHSGIGVLIYIIWPLCIIYMFKRCNLTNKYIDRINFIMAAGWVLSIIGSSQYTDAYFASFDNGTAVVGINPNTMAVVIAVTCLFLGAYIDYKIKSRLLKIVIYAVSLIALYQTRARASLVAVSIIFLLEFLFTRKLVRSRRMALFIASFVIIAGIIFPFVYVELFSNDIITYETQFLGKRVFTGRQYIWLNLWNYLCNNPDAYIWGVGYNTDLYSKGTFNMHNAFLMIFAQFGIMVLTIYILYLACSIKDMYGKFGHISNFQFKCYLIILYVMIVGFGETTLSYLPNLIFIAMAIGIGCREKIGGRLK